MNRLRDASEAVQPPDYLVERVRLSFQRAKEPACRAGQRRRALQFAAALGLGLVLFYEIGSLRLRTFWHEAYIHSVSMRVSSLMRVGLGDHIHCAALRKYTQDTPAQPATQDSIGTELAGIIPLVRDHMPAGIRLVMAHRCKHRGRPFVHLTFKGATHLLSLVLTDKREGESFDTEGLLPSEVRSGIRLFHGQTFHYQIASFETTRHLVYMVSDLSARQNSSIMLAVAPELHAFLQDSGA